MFELNNGVGDDRLGFVESTQTNERDASVGVGDLHIGDPGQLQPMDAGRNQGDPLPRCDEADNRRVLGGLERRVVRDPMPGQERAELGVE